MVKLSMAFKAQNVHMGRLEKGADIIQSLERFCRDKGIQAGWVNVIGALDRGTISYYHQQEKVYRHHPLNGDYEIVSCTGNISLKDGQPFAHLHIVLSDTSYQTWGGHLWPGTVSVFAAEFVLFELAGETPAETLNRCPDVETGLALW
ncbi:PPC domain-containing DNA-binding protein [Vampirovibrio sp.]|uniref:PPC domain-containing DNA-binding protein n=1 Tax=Vampirovibrio sp. TaxID=2717857 RepID=UPI0035947078